MPRKASRRTTTARTLAGTVLTVALLTPLATACGPETPATAAATTAAAAPTTTTTAVPTTTTPTATTPTATPTATPTSTPTATPTPKPKSPSGRNYPLVDGSTAEVQPTGNQNYTARIIHNGAVLATLETKNADAGLDANDMFVVLSIDGQVHSWMGGAHQGPGTFKLAGGWTAKVTKVGELHYRAQILGLDNAVNATLEANQHDTGAVANGTYIVLTAGGRISAHM